MPHATSYRRNQWRHERAKKLRRLILEAFDNKCVACGSRKKLEVNHLYGRDWTPRKVTIYYRWLRYWREFQAKLVDVRCSTCNAKYRPVAPPKPF